MSVRGSWAREVGPFVALTFGISWGLWAVCLALGGDVTEPLVALLWVIGAFGPSLAAVILRLVGRRGAQQARLRSAHRWVPAAVLIGVLPLSVGAGVAGSVDLAVLSGPAFLVLQVVMVTAEEFGWRGHAQPRLRRALPPVRAALTVGAIWAVWHAPLFVIDGSGQSAIPLPSVAAAIYFLSFVPLSVGYWFVSERLRGGVPAALLLHLSTNVVLALVTVSSITLALVVLAVAVAIAALIGWLAVVRTAARAPGRRGSGRGRR